jgi:hypothetical protein
MIVWNYLICRKRMDRALKDLEEKQNSKKESVCFCFHIIFLVELLDYIAPTVRDDMRNLSRFIIGT